MYGVIRWTSFGEGSSDGIRLVFDEDRGERRMQYGVEVGRRQGLIDEKMVEKEKWRKEGMRESGRLKVG